MPVGRNDSKLAQSPWLVCDREQDLGAAPLIGVKESVYVVHQDIMAQIAAEQLGNTLSENARLFALLNLAQADAAIMCWNVKFSTDFWRPITAIREADTDGNDDTTADPTWEPLIPTPPFPTYTSGHSSFSGAAAGVLASFFGTDDFAFTLPSETAGVADRSYTSFSQAAEESRDSRLYGGIHFRFDNEDGYTSGESLGQYISANFLQELPDAPIVEQQDGTLLVVGTDQDDNIQILSFRGGVRVIIGGHSHGKFDGVESIVIDGRAGNDTVVRAGNIAIPAEIHGGQGDDYLAGEAGDDTLHGDGGADILLGGDGDDRIFGGAGRELAIGGLGADWLLSQGHDDILIGGSTTADADQAALDAILAEWSSNNPVEDRIANLEPLLNDSTGLDDGEVDRLNGGGGRDWYIDFALGDDLAGFNRNRRTGDRLNAAGN